MSRRPASATPTFRSSTERARAPCRWCWVTRPRVSSRRLAPGSTTLRPATTLSASSRPAAAAAPPGAEGRPALCERAARHHGVGELMTGARRLSMDGTPVNHHVGVSAFACHAVLSRQSLVKVEADVAPHLSALFSCAMLTGAGAGLQHGPHQAGLQGRCRRAWRRRPLRHSRSGGFGCRADRRHRPLCLQARDRTAHGRDGCRHGGRKHGRGRS